MYPFGELTQPEPHLIQLDNGVRIHSLRTLSTDLPVFALSVHLRTPYNLYDNFAPIRLLPEMLVEGTADADTAAVTEQLECLGASLRSDCIDTHIFWQMRGLTEHAAATLHPLRDMVAAPPFREDALARRRDIEAAALAASAMTVEDRAHRKICSLWYGHDTPSGREMSVEELQSVSTAQLTELYRRAYDPGRIDLVLSGQVTPELEDSVARIFSTLPPGEPESLQPRSVRRTVAAEGVGRYHVPMAEATQTALRFRLPGVEPDDADYPMFDLAVTALGGYFGSRLMQNLREDKSLTYGIYSRCITNSTSTFVNISAECRSDMSELAVDEVRSELSRLDTNPPEGDELERLCKFALFRLASRVDSPLAAAGCYASDLMSGVGPDLFRRLRHAADNATPDALADVVRRRLRPEEAIVVTAGPVNDA